MGSCFSNCSIMGNSKKTQSLIIANEVMSYLKDLIRELNFKLPISFDIWRFHISKEAETYMVDSISSLLFDFYKKNKISVYNQIGFYEIYLSVHLAYAIVSKMLDPTYTFGIVDGVPIDQIMWKKPQLKKKVMLDFVNVFYHFPDLQIIATTKNTSEHILLNKKMTTILKKTLDSLNMYEIIAHCHNTFVESSNKKTNETQALLKNNM